MAGTSLAHSFQPTKTSNPRRQSGIRAFKRTSTDDEQVEKTAVAQRIEPAPRPIWDSIPTAFPPGQSGAGFGALGAGSVNLLPCSHLLRHSKPFKFVLTGMIGSPQEAPKIPQFKESLTPLLAAKLRRS